MLEERKGNYIPICTDFYWYMQCNAFNRSKYFNLSSFDYQSVFNLFECTALDKISLIYEAGRHCAVKPSLTVTF